MREDDEIRQELMAVSRVIDRKLNRFFTQETVRYRPTARWPAWAMRLWRWATRWRLYEHGYNDGWDAAERCHHGD